MPKILGASLAEHRTHTRERLFAALASLIAERNFESLTMAEIAAAAQVGRTAVYNHFPDKESLLLAFITHETQDYSAMLEGSLRDISDPIDQLRVYIRKQLELGTNYHLAPGTNLSKALSSDATKELHGHATMVETILHRILGTAMMQERIPRQNPSLLIGLIHSCLAGWHLPSDPVKRDYIVTTTQLFILRAIGADTSELEGIVPKIPSLNFEEENVTSTASACPVHHKSV